MRPRLLGAFAFILTFAVYSSQTQADPMYYPDRASFLGAVGPSITDGYTAYTPGQYTNAAMTAVLGETSYEALTFQDLNLVGNVFIRGDGTNYCAGCNGNFRLSFDSTSFSKHGGVFGVGLDIVLHTSRRVSIGDDDPSNPTFEGSVVVQFADGSTEQIWIPADIGYYEPSIYFLGITDERGIASITIGTEPLNSRHFWVIDNLTIASSPTTSVNIDIQPGSFPNSLNPRSQGVIPVAILTTGTFDAVTVDPLSVEFGPKGAMEAHGQGHIEDVNGDGHLDLVLHFNTQDTGIQCGQTSAALTGETFAGQLIQGSDSIQTVGCK
jgi:hypothetical protein